MKNEKPKRKQTVIKKGSVADKQVSKKKRQIKISNSSTLFSDKTKSGNIKKTKKRNALHSKSVKFTDTSKSVKKSVYSINRKSKLQSSRKNSKLKKDAGQNQNTRNTRKEKFRASRKTVKKGQGKVGYSNIHKNLGGKKDKSNNKKTIKLLAGSEQLLSKRKTEDKIRKSNPKTNGEILVSREGKSKQTLSAKKIKLVKPSTDRRNNHQSNVGDSGVGSKRRTNKKVEVKKRQGSPKAHSRVQSEDKYIPKPNKPIKSGSKKEKGAKTKILFGSKKKAKEIGAKKPKTLNEFSKNQQKEIKALRRKKTDLKRKIKEFALEKDNLRVFFGNRQKAKTSEYKGDLSSLKDLLSESGDIKISAKKSDRILLQAIVNINKQVREVDRVLQKKNVKTVKNKLFGRIKTRAVEEDFLPTYNRIEMCLYYDVQRVFGYMIDKGYNFFDGLDIRKETDKVIQRLNFYEINMTSEDTFWLMVGGELYEAFGGINDNYEDERANNDIKGNSVIQKLNTETRENFNTKFLKASKKNKI